MTIREAAALVAKNGFRVTEMTANSMLKLTKLITKTETLVDFILNEEADVESDIYKRAADVKKSIVDMEF
jgi:hypothetical protein